MTLQDIFDVASQHLLRQNAKSLRPIRAAGETVGFSAYRSLGGRKCAVGALITDAAYSAAIEGQLVDSPCVIRALENSGVDVGMEQMQLLVAMQRVHDEFYPHEWRREFTSVADDFRLAFVGQNVARVEQEMASSDAAYILVG